MSTRSTTHFTYGNKHPQAIVYRHSYGYPSGAGVDIHKFFDECSKISDSRFSDPSYLAAKYVVFLADMFNQRYDSKLGDRPESKLEFLSVGVVMADPVDIQYRYVIDCSNIVEGRPTVTCFERTDWEKNTWREVSIPLSRASA